jgi:hypothetical protein
MQIAMSSEAKTPTQRGSRERTMAVPGSSEVRQKSRMRETQHHRRKRRWHLSCQRWYCFFVCIDREASLDQPAW